MKAAFRSRRAVVRPRGRRRDDEPKGPVAVLDSMLDSPASRPAARQVMPVTTALPVDVERRLAELVGIEPVVGTEPAGDVVPDPSYDESKATHFAKRVLQVAQQMTVGSLLLLVVCAVAAARIDNGSLKINPRPVTAWAMGAALCAVGVAALVTDPDAATALSGARRRVLGAVMMIGLLVATSGVVANADGVAAPAWVLYLPIVVVSGAVLGPVLGLLVGALAGCGLYAAAVVSHTLTIDGVGWLVVILPALPLFGWAAGALASCAHEAVSSARRQRVELIDDVGRLANLLGSVADGDLSKVPVLDDPADQATASLAVVLADMVLSLRRLVRQLSGVADQLADNAGELAATAASQAAAVDQQASAVSETTSTIEQLAATATTISEIAERVATFAGSTRRDVDVGVQSVAKSTAAMEVIGRRVKELGDRTTRLNDRVAKIATTTRLIDELGRRTTMLAVNASIEAARVGEDAGGFGTVAQEIAGLATKARAATADIARIVTELENEVAATGAVSKEGVAAVSVGLARQVAVEESLAQISSRVDDTTSAARDITGATRQQRGASDGVVSAMHAVTSASDVAAFATRGHLDSAERLRDLMNSLLAAVARFRVE